MPAEPPHQRQAEFEQIALPLLDSLYGTALHLTRDRKDAEDLVQETYLRAFRFFESFAPGTNVKAWMYRILRNTFINRYRAARARPEEVDFDKVEAAWESAVDETWLRARRLPTPEEAALEGVLDEEVSAALDELPEDYRAVVLLALVEDLTYKEVAEALSIPIGTVMSRLHRGRKLLQARLGEYARRRGIIRPPAGVPGDGENP